MAQGVFESNTSSGRWDVSGSWTLISGSDADGIPDSDDDVTILSGDLIELRAPGSVSVNDLTIVGILDYPLGNRTLNVLGNLTMSGTSSVTGNSANRNLNVTGSFEVSTGASVTINGASITISGATTLNGTINFPNTSGNKTFNDITVNASGHWNINSIRSFTINGNITNNGTWTGCSASSGCVYTLASSSGTISGSASIDISDLTINSPSSYTNSTTLSVSNAITGTGTFINGANATLSYSGDNSLGTNFDITNFTASANNNTVIMSGSTNQLLRQTTSTDNNYYNLTISTTAAGNDVTLDGNITIDNQLTMTLGDLLLSGNRLTIAVGATVSGGNSNSYIGINGIGVLRQLFSSTGATLSFPIGDIDDYCPITSFVINSATIGAGAYVEFDITDANHPNQNSSNTGSGGDDDGTAAVDFISRYWTLTANNISGVDFNVSYQYVDADVNGTEANLVGTLYRTPPGFAFNDWYVLGTVNATTNIVTLIGGDAFGDLCAMDNTLDRLPVVLVSFQAFVNRSQVELKWVTASETNNELYTIERSIDGEVFYPILTKPGSGNTSQTTTYTATDNTPPEGRVFYRLKQIDFNGSFEYSEIVSVNVEPDTDVLSFNPYPNPVTRGEILSISWKDKTSISEIDQIDLVDLSGSTVLKFKEFVIKGEVISIRVPSRIEDGVYIFRVNSRSKVLQKKILIR